MAIFIMPTDPRKRQAQKYIVPLVQAQSIVPLVLCRRQILTTLCFCLQPSPATQNSHRLALVPPPPLAAKLDTEPELHGVSDQVRSETMHARRKPRDKKIVAAVAPRAAPAVVGRRGQEPNVLFTLAARDSPGRRRTPRAEPNVLLTLAARDGRHRAFGADPLSPAQARFP